MRIEPGDSLDLHTFDPRDIPGVVDDFLTMAGTAGFTLVRVIHGRGTGVQRAVVRRQLARHPLVSEFWDAPESHLGATLVRLVETT
ncbi:MAG: Smr/MutS family protein [Vicinamibacterales bacterium]